MTNTLILLRHGQSVANAKGIFTGLLDVPLTDVGRTEAAHGADLLNDAEMWPKVWFCSPLLRAQQTATILRAKISHAPERTHDDWRLAERSYGALTGRSKREVLAEHGAEKFLAWRRSVHVAPPPMPLEQRAIVNHAPEVLSRNESLHDVIARVRDIWEESIAPAVQQRGSALVVAHGNSLRALCVVLDRLDEAEVRDLNIPTGHPLVYRIKDGRPLTRGGQYLEPVAATSAAAKITREGGT